MKKSSNLNLTSEMYDKTKAIISNNGSRVWEHAIGSVVNLYSDGSICATIAPNDYLFIGNITKQQFGSFIGLFTKSLYSQFKKNPSLFNLKIDFNGLSRSKNYEVWYQMPQSEIYYNVDLTSAYWQIAYRLGYISKKMYDSFMHKNEFKEAKRYCISFLSRTNLVTYHDGREISEIECNMDCLIQVYENIRNELYKCIDEVRKNVENWIEYNIDAIAVSEKDLELVCKMFDEMDLTYKIKEYVKIDEYEYVTNKGKIRNF